MTPDPIALAAAAEKHAAHKRHFIATRLHYGDSILRRFREDAIALDRIAADCRYAAEGCKASWDSLNDYLEHDSYGIAMGVEK